MLVTPTMTPSEQASILYMVKILMSVAGFVVFCLGAILYLYVLVRDRSTAAARTRRALMVQSADERVGGNPT